MNLDALPAAIRSLVERRLSRFLGRPITPPLIEEMEAAVAEPEPLRVGFEVNAEEVRQGIVRVVPLPPISTSDGSFRLPGPPESRVVEREAEAVRAHVAQVLSKLPRGDAFARNGNLP